MINRRTAHRFVTFYHAYHGNTLATMAASWSPTRTARGYGPGVKFLPFHLPG
jgi:acetylornithine/succinyldiaminopimelate/putrescine aminotransferase